MVIMMINVGRIVNGRNTQSFTVYRKSGAWASGRWPQTEATILLSGVISVAKEKDLIQVPEGDRTGGAIVIHTTQVLYITYAANGPANGGTSDEVLWQGDRYRLLSVAPYVDYGYYKSIGVRMAGD